MAEIVQPSLFKEELFVEWRNGACQVKGAGEMLNEKLYKRLAVKLRRESEERIYKHGEQYFCQELFRDAAVRGAECLVSPPRAWRCFDVHDFIRIGEAIFKLVKKDGRNQHFSYELQD